MMASRMIHYVIAKQIASDLKIKDVNAFCIGAMIADSFKIRSKNPKARSHFFDEVGDQRYINYLRFQEKYLKNELDDFCLGYFLHLYMDAINWKKIIIDIVFPYQNGDREENVKLFYEDNHRWNTHLRKKYDLSFDLTPLNKFNVEEVDIEDQQAFLDLFKEDFEDIEDDGYVLFTKEMFESFMEEYYQKGLDILKVVMSFKTCDDGMQYLVRG